MNYQIKTHRIDQTYSGIHFFVLNRGNNTGKVLSTPCPNCWVIFPDSPETADALKTIIRAMHLSGTLRHHLIGSVVPFIRIKEFRKLLGMHVEKVGLKRNLDRHLQKISQMTELVEQYAQIQKKAKLALQVMHLELLRGG
jgi:hypothetical protein